MRRCPAQPRREADMAFVFIRGILSVGVLCPDDRDA
jgi:hypothetical protein